jgi:hypothetical protein
MPATVGTTAAAGTPATVGTPTTSGTTAGMPVTEMLTTTSGMPATSGGGGGYGHRENVQFSFFLTPSLRPV